MSDAEPELEEQPPDVARVGIPVDDLAGFTVETHDGRASIVLEVTGPMAGALAQAFAGVAQQLAGPPTIERPGLIVPGWAGRD